MDASTLAILKESATVSAIYCFSLFVLHVLLAQLWKVVLRGKLTKKSEKLWQNKSVATLHAITMFYLTATYWFTINYEMKISDHAGSHEKRCLDLMMGYLWYDSIYEITMDGQVDTLGHHVLGLVSHMSSRLSNSGPAAFYSMLVYIAEGSTPALHTLWLLHQLKLTHLTIYKGLVAFLLLAFLVFRICLSPFMVWHMLQPEHVLRWGAHVHELWHYDFNLYWGNTAIVFLFGCLNYFWFYKLISLALKPSAKKEKKSK